MRGRRLPLAFLFPILICLFIGTSARGQTQIPQIPLGSSAVELTGPWKFHTGDNPRWADSAFDDAAWNTIDLDPPDHSRDPFMGTPGFVAGWTRQGYSGYSGYAWYRLRVRLTGLTESLSLKMPDNFDDAYQVFVNGQFIGEFGKFTGRGVTPYFAVPRSFRLPANLGRSPVTIAIRMWMDPATPLTSADAGGLHGPPVIGEVSNIAAMERLAWVDVVRSSGGVLLEMAILVLAILVAVGLAWLDRTQPAYRWLGAACIVSLLYPVFVVVGTYTNWIGSTAGFLLLDAVVSPVRFGVWVLFWGYWFRLHHMARLHRAVWSLVLLLIACSAMLHAPLYGGVISSHASVFLVPLAMMLKLLMGVLLAAVVYRGIRLHKTEGWLASPAVLLLGVSMYQLELHTLHMPVFFFPLGIQISVGVISIILSLAIVTVLLLRRFLHGEREREKWKLEVQQAQQVQQVLIPESIPAIPGFAITGEYRPAQQVGGDFFQVISGEDRGVLAIVGDVSGKGLKAAMTVSLIVGTLRTLAEYETGPAALLTGLNRRLLGRLGDGFATCIILKMTSDGMCTLANAGHPAPYLNGNELSIAGSLPVGMVMEAGYEEQSFVLAPGDRLTFYTDGVLEARNAQGELFGFDRLSALLMTQPSAASVADAACAFGQEDDITVLTMERLAAEKPPSRETLIGTQVAHV